MNVKDYINQHDAINYCEAIIYPNGDIEDANPSHIYKLINVTKLPQKTINILMPDNAAPLEWLLGFTGCVSIWYDLFKYDSITDEQLNTIQELVNHNKLFNGIIGIHTDEYTRCDLLDKFYKGEIDNVPDRPNEKIQIWRK